jgi:4-amino-4-deoxy-L-arabinose transferase-like glycosyltransferase
MHYVSLIVEFLRGRPPVVFWTATLTQAALWLFIPALFYTAPPGGVPLLLAIGHEFRLGSYLGPPLAFWFGELAFRAAGMFGVYLLAQICVVTTYWAVFALGRLIVGTRHAVLAVLLMVGIASFSVPTPDFGPGVLAMPFWALALLHYWRAIGEGGRGYWFLLAVDLGLLLLSSYAGLILIAMLMLFSLASGRARRALVHVEPWIALLLLSIVIFPHAMWLKDSFWLVVEGFRTEARGGGAFSPPIWLALVFVASYLGLAVLVVLSSGWRVRRRERAPEITRNPVERGARFYVYFFAVVPFAAALGLAWQFGAVAPLERIAPLVVLSGLAVIILAGDRILLYRERMASSAWLGLLAAPPLLAVAGIVILPWTLGIDLSVNQPAAAMGQFFADNYQRRTGRPLAYVAGDLRLASLVAMASPSRPSLYFESRPERSPWATADDLRREGAVLVWPATDTTGTPPAAIKADFPELIQELPRAFARPVQGLLPLIRVGWSVLRPQTPR